MPALRETQFAFADAVIHGGGAELLPQLRGNGLPPASRVGVYRNNFYSNLVSALRSTFPVVERLVGEDFFRHAATEFVRRHPSVSGDLHQYGESLADFLAVMPAAAGLPYLPDVARLEWAWHEVFHAESDAGHFDFAGLQRLSPEQHAELRFQPNRAYRLLASPWPVLRIWQVNQDGFGDEPAVDLAEGEARMLVMQRQLLVEILPLSRGEYRLLQTLALGYDLTGAYEAAAKEEPELDLAACLRRHIELGTLVRWNLPGDFLSDTDPRNTDDPE